MGLRKDGLGLENGVAHPAKSIVFCGFWSTYLVILFRGIIRITKCEISTFDFEDTAGEISALTARHAR